MKVQCFTAVFVLISIWISIDCQEYQMYEPQNSTRFRYSGRSSRRRFPTTTINPLQGPIELTIVEGTTRRNIKWPSFSKIFADSGFPVTPILVKDIPVTTPTTTTTTTTTPATTTTTTETPTTFIPTFTEASVISVFRSRRTKSTTTAPSTLPHTTTELFTTEDYGRDRTSTTTKTETRSTTTKSPSPSCGSRVGNNAPWIAVIEHTDPTIENSPKTLSKGVLISNRHVLTTVSSIHNTNPFWVASAIRLGDPITFKSSQRNSTTSNVIRIAIDRVYKHKIRDIALIKLAKSVNFTDFIQPICLPSNDEFYNYSEMILHICRKNKGSSQKQVGHSIARPVSLQDCRIMFERKGVSLTKGVFCAWDEFGDNCTGDIGGPLMVNESNNFTVIGLSSLALSDAEFDSSDLPGVYVNVGYYLRWINSVMNLNE